MLSRRRLLRSASAITAARTRADVYGSKERSAAAEAAAVRAPDPTAPLPQSDKAETPIERINNPETVVDAARRRDVTTK
jgi:hypothetical protein